MFPELLLIMRPLFNLWTASKVILNLDFDICNVNNLFASTSKLWVQTFDFGTLKEMKRTTYWPARLRRRQKYILKCAFKHQKNSKNNYAVYSVDICVSVLLKSYKFK